MLSQNDLEGLIGPILLEQFSDRRLNPMSVQELKEALRDIPGAAGLTVSYRNGNQVIHLGERSVEVGPMASNDEIRAALQNPFVPTRNTRVTVSAIDRIKAKALQARSVVPEAIKGVESDLDSILAEKDVIAKKRFEAVAPHMEAIAGVKGELDGLKSALDLLSNGGPPLEESNTSAPASNA